MQVDEPPKAAAAPQARAPAGDLPLWVLMSGNLMIGSGILAPSSMMNQLVEDLKVTPVEIGALIGWGAVVLCIGAPTLAFATTRFGRRGLLAACLAVYAAGHAASAIAPDYQTLLWVRLAMIAAAAVYTPQAAGTVALMVPPDKRAAAVAFVFMGWSVAGAAVAPALSILSESAGWRLCFALVAAGSFLAMLGVIATAPRKLVPAPISIEAWRAVITTPVILILLLTTMVQLMGQFVLFPYLAAEAKRAGGANPGEVAILLGVFGAAGLFGSILCARYVGRIGAPAVQFLCLAAMAAGLALWGVFAHLLPAAMVAAGIWGLGFGGAVSMQQARLIAVAPLVASASVALNTSFLYLGQALGSTIGGQMIIHGAADYLAYAGALLMIGAIGLSVLTRRRFGA
jgi:MFS transporter, DHA1 family, inner membrane transport protein